MSLNEIMSINWQQMIQPKLQIAGDFCYGKFVCEPIEKGFGITLGNSLRRIMLSSIYGAAIVSVRFDSFSIMHEFSAIPGVFEDVTEIILNLKQIRFKVDNAEPKTIHIEKDKEGAVTAKDISYESSGIEVLNPDNHIATLSDGAKLKLTMIVKVGKGYSLSENNKDENDPVGTIPIDAVFSPIKRVSYFVGNARIGQKTDYDSLTMEIWTDGSISPENAVAYSAKILKDQLNVFINFDDKSKTVVQQKAIIEEEPKKPKFNENLYRSVEELELSVRSANCLKTANISKIYQLVNKTEFEMLKTKNFGRKSLNEIKEVLSKMDLSLGMKLDGFVPPLVEGHVEEVENNLMSITHA